MKHVVFLLILALPLLAHAQTVSIRTDDFFDKDLIPLPKDQRGQPLLYIPQVQIYNDRGELIFHAATFNANQAGWKTIREGSVMVTSLSQQVQRTRLGLSPAKSGHYQVHYFDADKHCPPCRALRQHFEQAVYREMPANTRLDTIIVD